MPTLADALTWTRTGTDVFLAAATLDDASMAEPSLLPGWTRKHLIAHVAGNAEALGRLLTWAATGVETPMYTSREQRDADIESGSARSATELLDWARSSAEVFAEQADALDDDAWDALVRNGQGQQVAASVIPWLRARELYLHAADLGTTVTFADLPHDLLVAVCDGVAAQRAGDDSPAVRLVATDGSGSWDLHTDLDLTEVHAPLAELAAYLTGRPHQARLVSGEPAPELSRWL